MIECDTVRILKMISRYKAALYQMILFSVDLLADTFFAFSCHEALCDQIMPRVIVDFLVRLVFVEIRVSFLTLNLKEFRQTSS